MTETKAATVKSHFGSLAIAAAIVIAACIFGFVSSKAFAIFFMGSVMACIIAGIGIFLLFSVDKVGLISAIILGLLFFGAFAAFSAGIEQAVAALKAA